MLATLLGGAACVLGAGLVAMAVRQLARARAFLRDSITAAGRVVGELRQPDEARVYHFPRVSFRARDGREVTFQSQLGASVPVRIGSAVRVRYLPDRPERAELDTFAGRWLPAIVFGMIGDAFLTLGICLLVGWIPV